MTKISQHENLIKTFNEISATARNRKVAHLYTQDKKLDGRIVTIGGTPKVNFGSCSYLGLELDPRVKEASMLAIQNYGTQFSSSRAYLSCTPYEELESLISNIYNAPVILNTSSSMAHQSTIPLIVGDNDAVIFDQQVHSSVQELKYKLYFRGVHISILRHNRMDDLQNKINELKGKYDKIWYFLDGTYSMYGDFAPIEKLVEMLDANKQLHLYIDDAHSVSVYGKSGAGYVYQKAYLHPRMVITVSLAKGFGSCGGVTVFPPEMKDLYWKVKNCAGPLTFSGPLQPAILGASIASAKIHLSPEIDTLQKELSEKIRLCNELINYYNLPLVAETDSPIFFIGLGLTKVGYNMISRLGNNGLFCNLGIFPAVPESCTGIRFTITRHHTEADIEKLVKQISVHLPLALKDENRTCNDIKRSFKSLKFSPELLLDRSTNSASQLFHIEKEHSIHAIPEEVWNNLFPGGNFDWRALALYEESFSNNFKQEDNWDFYYYFVKDSSGKIVVATFFTSVLTKEDMLASESVSREIEVKRLTDNYYLTSRTFMMGCLTTEGDHIFIDKKQPLWKEAMMNLLDTVWEDQEQVNCNTIFLRDFDAADVELKEFFVDQGFVKIDMPASNIVNIEWSTREEYINHLPSKKRLHLKKNVIEFEPLFEVRIVTGATEERIDKWYELYDNVRRKNLQINGFKLPKRLFTNMAVSSDWDCIELSIEIDKVSTLVAVIFAYRNMNYSNAIIGLDYRYLSNYNTYKQTLFQTILKGIDLKVKQVNFGLTADFEKRKVGAIALPKVAFLQSKDHFQSTLLGLIGNNTAEVAK